MDWPVETLAIDMRAGARLTVSPSDMTYGPPAGVKDRAAELRSARADTSANVSPSTLKLTCATSGRFSDAAILLETRVSRSEADAFRERASETAGMAEE